MITFDSETHQFRQCLQAPPIVCIAVKVYTHRTELLLRDEALNVIESCLERGESFVGHNVAYDFACVAAARPQLLPAIFRAYREDRVTDTMIRQKLLDIAHGCYYGFVRRNGQPLKIGYGLDDMALRILGKHRNKGADTWRKRYAELDGVPLSRWPQDAIAYPIEDVDDSCAFFGAQEEYAQYLADQYRQARAAFALHLTSTWGIYIDQDRVDRLERETTAAYEECAVKLRQHGLLRTKGGKESRYMDAVKARVHRVYTEQGRPVPMTAGDKNVCTDALTCNESGDREGVLQAYGRLGQLKAILSKDVPMLRQGVIHTRFDLAESGRSTSAADGETGEGGNTQNINRKGGVRECFAARPGAVYASADYSYLELCTLAQACIDLLGYSKLADAINSGLDPHLVLTTDIMGISYESAVALKEAKDPALDNARQTSKVGNFGIPGGLGIDAFIAFALAQYNVRLDKDKASKLKNTTLGRWTEWRAYFQYVGTLVEQPGAQIVQLRSGRVRGKVGFTDGCNTFFQGLGADVAKSAMFDVAEACYALPESPLFGCRPVNFVHDEISVEAPEPRGHEAAIELGRLMVAAAKPWLPNVKISAEPLLARRWSKNSKALHDASGRLVPWDC